MADAAWSGLTQTVRAPAVEVRHLGASSAVAPSLCSKRPKHPVPLLRHTAA